MREVGATAADVSARGVSLFLPSLAGGGAERVMIEVAKGLLESGVPVQIVLAGRGGVNRALVPAGVECVELGARRVGASIGRLATYLRDRRPKSLLAVLSHCGIAALMSRRLASVPTRVLISEHIAFSSLKPYASVKLRLVARARRWFYRRADAVLAVSAGVADDVAEATGFDRSAIEVIPNPTITPEILRRAEAPLDDPWFRPGQPPVIVGMGRLKPHKDFPALIEAYARVRRFRQARLLILGEGPERSRLEEMVVAKGLQEDVSLPGFLVDPYRYLARSAVFVLCSNAEGLPGALLEAMAVGCPVVSTDCRSGPREILLDGRLAPLVPPGDVGSMAEAISATLDRRPDCSALRERARDFTLEAVLGAYRRVLEV